MSKSNPPISTNIRTFQIVQYVSGFMEGELKDWPDNIQEAVYRALERKADEVQLPLTVVFSQCGVDYSDVEGVEDRFFVQIIASEIVAKDLGLEEAMLREFEEKIGRKLH